jgi:hypothetical protein
VAADALSDHYLLNAVSTEDLQIVLGLAGELGYDDVYFFRAR